MIALGIDTSSGVCSLGVVSDDSLLVELNLHAGTGHSERLLPSIGALLLSARLKPEQLDLLAVAAGPGSFTGLRIGMATGKGMALALGRPAVGFSTLETIAMAVASGLPDHDEEPVIGVLLDAGRGEVYRGLFRCRDHRTTPLADEAALPPERAVAGFPETCILCGDGVTAYRERLAACLGPARRIVRRTPFIGAALARRAVALASQNRPERLPALTPNYLRLSDAERTFKG